MIVVVAFPLGEGGQAMMNHVPSQLELVVEIATMGPREDVLIDPHQPMTTEVHHAAAALLGVVKVIAIAAVAAYAAVLDGIVV
jgi:cytochrome b